MMVKSLLLGGMVCSSAALIAGRHYACAEVNSYTKSRGVNTQSEMNTSTGSYTLCVIEPLKNMFLFYKHLDNINIKIKDVSN